MTTVCTVNEIRLYTKHKFTTYSSLYQVNIVEVLILNSTPHRFRNLYTMIEVISNPVFAIPAHQRKMGFMHPIVSINRLFEPTESLDILISFSPICDYVQKVEQKNSK